MLPKARCSWPLAPADRLLVPGPGLLAISADKRTLDSISVKFITAAHLCQSLGATDESAQGVPFWAFLNPALMSYKDRFATVDFKSFKSMVAGDPGG